MKNFFITGASGFVGRHLIEQLKGVDGLKMLTPSHNDLDILDLAAASEFIQTHKPDCLIHLAWETDHGSFWESENNHKWVDASLSLFENFYKNGGERIVFAGSCAEYDWNIAGPISEDTANEVPETLYGKSKLAVTRAGLDLSRIYKKEFVSARLFFLFGPGEKSQRLVPRITAALLRGERAKCQNPEFVRDYLPVQEVAKVLSTVILSYVQGVINIGSGTGYRLGDLVFEIAKHVEELAGRKTAVDLGFGSAVASSVVAHVGRLERELGWPVVEGGRHLFAEAIKALLILESLHN